MGAYENPTQAIDRESGMIIANAISRIGQQTANYLQTYADARNKEVEEAKKEEDARLAAQEINRDTIHANIQKAGGRSQSWFDLADNAINLKFKYEGLLDDAPDEDIENEDGTITYSKKTLHGLINKEKAKIRTLTQSLLDIKAWSGTQGQKLLNSKTNEAGGIYTGSCKEGSSKFNKSICQDYERKMALMGTLTKDGKVVTDVKYDIREICPDSDDSSTCIPSVWATIDGKDSFNVSDILAQDYAEAENIFKGEDNDGINFVTGETGIFNKQDKLIDSMMEAPFMEDVIDQQTGKKIGVKAIRPVDINKVLGVLTPAYEAHFVSMVNSVENRQDYNDLMATYLVYSKDGEDLETVADGVWKLTDEAKSKFVQAMVGYSLEKKIPGYETISAKENEDGTITFLNQEGQEETVEANTKYSYKGEIGELTGEFADRVTEDLTGPQGPPSKKFSEQEIKDINNTVAAFKRGAAYTNTAVGMTYGGKKVSSVGFNDNKVTLNYIDKNGDEVPIPQYDGTKLNRDELERMVKKYVNTQYDLGQKQRSKLTNQIINELMKKEITQGDPNNLPTGDSQENNLKILAKQLRKSFKN